MRYFVTGHEMLLYLSGDREEHKEECCFELPDFESKEEAVAAAREFIKEHKNAVNDQKHGIGSVTYWTAEVTRCIEDEDFGWLPCDADGATEDGHGLVPADATAEYICTLDGSREVPPPMGKQYAILRVQKCKGAEIGAMQYHNDREPGKHTNPDIDPTRTRMNREMCPHADYEGEVQARIDAGYSGTRKVRKDAVRLVEGIVTASPEFFEGASDEEVRGFFDSAFEFCREEFGESNMVHFTVHMDEETPHAHFGFVPLRDGKLSWKGFFPDKAALGAMQDRFYERVGALYGLSRGEKRGDGEPVRRHKSVAEYKAENRRVQAELDEKSERLEAVTAELAAVSEDLKEVRAQCSEYKAKLDGFAAAEAFISTHGNEVNDEEDGIGSVIYWTVEVERRVEYKENEWLPCDESGRIDDGYGNEPNATVAYLSSLEGSREERAFELAKNEYLAWLEHKEDRYTTVYGYMD